MYSQYHCTLNVWCSTISLVINNSLVQNFELVISNDDNNSSKESKKFPRMMILSAIPLKNPSLRLTRQIYHWLAHNSVNFEVAFSLLLIPPFHEYVTVRKCNVLLSLMTNNSSMNRIFNLKSTYVQTSCVKYIPLLCQIRPDFIQKSSLFYQQSLGMIQTHVPNIQFTW